MKHFKPKTASPANPRALGARCRDPSPHTRERPVVTRDLASGLVGAEDRRTLKSLLAEVSRQTAKLSTMIRQLKTWAQDRFDFSLLAEDKLRTELPRSIHCAKKAANQS